MNSLIEGVRKRFEPLIQEQARKIEFIDYNYKAAMMEFAATELQLTNSTKKSIKFPWGTLGFTSSKGKLEVDDAPLAAYTLLQDGQDEAVILTINIAELRDKAQNEPLDSFERMLYSMVKDAFEIHTEEVEDAEDKIVAAKPTTGLSFGIKASALPADVDNLPGVHRIKPDHALGNFAVKH